MNPKDRIGSKKAPVSCVPQGVIAEVGLAMFEGACKYGRHNYRAEGVYASVNYDAARGHIDAWWEGEDVDAESGLSHVTKAIAALCVLRDSMMMGVMKDDRPPRIPQEYRPRSARMNAKAAAISERYSPARAPFTALDSDAATLREYTGALEPDATPTPDATEPIA
jgi:hypothetical protein